MQPRPSNAALLDAASHRRWEWLAEHLKPEHITPHDLGWAVLEGAYDSDPDVRLVAANYLAVSNLHLNIVDRGAIVAWMVDEDCAEARLLLSAALYKRGDRDPVVVQVFTDACKDATVGELARKFKEAA